MAVSTAVIPAAGLGTRFLPATKAQPKGLLPVVDVPAIQLVVEEAIAAGLDHVVIVIGPGQEALRDHFAPNLELEAELEARGKDEALAAVRRATIPGIRFVLQEEARGLGHAVAQAEPLVEGRPFAVLLGDDLIHPSVKLLERMIAGFERSGGAVIAAMDVGPREIAMYGCIEPGETDGDLVRILSIVEKPAPQNAPSSLAVMGRYVFGPSVFDALRRTPPGKGGEIQLTDAIGLLTAEGRVSAYPFEGGRFDVGNPLDAMKAQVAFALERDDIGPAFRAWLHAFLGETDT